MKNAKHDIKKHTRDELLGAALVGALADSDASGDCPGDEDLAALLERALPEDERERLQAHLASCDDCLARYTVAARLHLPKAAPARRSRLGYAAGLAALAAGIAAIVLTRQQSGNPTLPSAPQMTAERAPAGPVPKGTAQEPALQAYAPQERPERGVASVATPAASATVVALAALVYDGAVSVPPPGGATGNSYGFSEALSPGKIAFRTGVAGMDLGAALKSGDPAARDAAVGRLGDLLGKGAAARLRELVREPASDRMRQHYLLAVKEIEQRAGGNGQALLFRFGAWSEAGRLAGDAALGRVVDRASIRRFREGLQGDDLPQGVRNSLEKMDASLLSSAGGALDTRRIRHALDEIVDIY